MSEIILRNEGGTDVTGNRVENGAQQVHSALDISTEEANYSNIPSANSGAVVIKDVKAWKMSLDVGDPVQPVKSLTAFEDVEMNP